MEETDISFVTSGLSVRTEGFRPLGRRELSVQVPDEDLLPEAENFLSYAVSYLISEGERIEPGETMNYGYWIVKFEPADDGMLHVWEYTEDFSELVPGANLAMAYWRYQHEICEQFGAEFMPPAAGHLAVVFPEVFEGDPVQGIRYPPPPDMSGWWITSDRYDGDVNTLKVQHLYHLTAARPDLSPYLALPPGFRYNFEGTEDIWFDPEVAAEPVA